VIASLLFGGAVLAACSNGTTTSASTTRPPRTPTTGAAASTTTAVSPSTAESSTTVPTLSQCPAKDLVGSVAGSTGAAGTLEVTVSLRSTASSSCILAGYPGLQLLGPGGAALPTTVIRKGAYSFTAMAPAAVRLSTGQSAEFNLGYSDVPVGTETSCPTATALEVTPPDNVDHLTVAASLAPCGRGTLVVSPMFAAAESTTESTAPPP
jgi:Protein of unknown function (DUF4232)